MVPTSSKTGAAFFRHAPAAGRLPDPNHPGTPRPQRRATRDDLHARAEPRRQRASHPARRDLTRPQPHPVDTAAEFVAGTSVAIDDVGAMDKIAGLPAAYVQQRRAIVWGSDSNPRIGGLRRMTWSQYISHSTGAVMEESPEEPYTDLLRQLASPSGTKPEVLANKFCDVERMHSMGQITDWQLQIEFSRNARRLLRQNLVFAVVYNGVIVFLLQIDTLGLENSSRDSYLQKRLACSGAVPTRPTLGVRRPCHFAPKIRLPLRQMTFLICPIDVTPQTR